MNQVKMPEQTALQRNTVGMLNAFAARSMPMYEGTAKRSTVLANRRRNKAARKARRSHRG